ncbi:DNA polymerase III subunit delta' [Psychromonas sp. 14N.309.X.WAT.B.A12]|uniref:DNA polymerase III subunit delta' n=1 Tax=unclassified Psychromonas TaxID=2614957 RepID=UPI0025B1CC89|nr:DNA polymerase III subunit delta' [Psychromonas sp. 14N.309.X.WAT.B.A12]MDN2662421.1 DNA polymerase III subunit delta' [Psychromonas sp. 14N.309.X.WAT.B.A12]
MATTQVTSDMVESSFEQVSTPWLTPFYQQLQQTYLQGRFAHGLLFTGSAGIGKYKLAQQLAQYLLCTNKQHDDACFECHSCKLFSAHNHLDYHLLVAEKNKSIGIDQIRLLTEKLNERPQLGNNKVVLIKGAEQLTEAAANALLKTLEEPQGDSYLVLLARTHHQLMPTLLSRLQQTHLHSPDDQSLINWLYELGYQVSDLGVLRWFQNSPLALLNHLKALQQDASLDTRRQCVEGVFNMLYQPQQLFSFSRLLANDAEQNLLLLFHLLHDIHKLKLNTEQLDQDAIYYFALPQLQLWQAQLSFKSLRMLSQEILKTRSLLTEHNALKKELLISALLIKIKNEFKETHHVS